MARAIGVSRRVLVASPDYLRRHGPITEPSDLREHQCIVFSGAEKQGVWSFDGPSGRVSVHVHGRLALSTVDALQDAVLAGLGLAIMPAWFWTRERLDGQVVELLPDYKLPVQAIHALTTARLGSVSKVRRLVDHIEQALHAVGSGHEANELSARFYPESRRSP